MPRDNPFEPMIKNIGNYVSGGLYAQGVIPPIGIDNYDGTALASPADTHLLAAKDPVIDEIAVGMSGNLIGENTVMGTPPLQLPNSAGYPLQAWSVDLLPYQEGSGDPSPDNVRPIHGTDKVTVYTDSKYGGLVEWNQIFPTRTINYSGTGFTITSDNNGVVVVTVTTDGTSENNAHNHTSMSIPNSANGHKCILLSNSPDVKVELKATSTVSDVVFTATSGWNNVAFMFNNLSAGIYNVYPMLCDLTQMFGAGNEPSTVADFRALFPNEYYAYNAGQQMTVDQVNGAQYTPAVITLPQTVYTGTIGSEGGESRWGEVDLGDLHYSDNGAIEGGYQYAAVIIDKAYGEFNIMSDIFHRYVNRPTELWSAQGRNYSTTVAINVPYSSSAETKAALAGHKLVYELATPIQFPLTTPAIPTTKGTATTWATAEDGTVDSMSVSYIQNE